MTAEQVPPNGWEIPDSEERQLPPEFDGIAQALTQLFSVIPNDVQAAISDAAKATADAARALLDVIRRVIEWLASILERHGADARSGAEAGRQVHDIPIL